MAADKPVKDVLCEAMDYLSKLGSNLRIRSENLKEKKIRRDKLTNVLAVQKAADKVLLICELSKKSLANVETGVRKILEHIDVTQASSSRGGKSSSSKTDSKKRDNTHKYHYFDYKSRKLRIKNKISLKHYKSVKVLARKMSSSMIDKYPVYHDCKLYRMRRKSKKSGCAEQDESESGNEQNITEFGLVNSRARALSNKIQNHSDTDTSNPKTKSIKNKIRALSADSDDQKDTKQNNRMNNTHDGHSDSEYLAITPKRTSPDTTEHELNKSCEEKEPEERKLTLDDNNCDSALDCSKVSNKISENQIDSDNHDTKINDSDSNSTKPIIKCVSLSKLLKPDVLQKDPTILSVPLKVKRDFNVNKKNKMLQSAKKNKEELCAQKRKEVLAFKPKKFDINITRLPELSTKFLVEHSLDKITKAGEIICEIAKNKFDIAAQELTEVNDDVLLKAKTKKVKKSLLNESDSDTNEKQTETTVDKIKSALLDSDSDQSDITSKVDKGKEPENRNEKKNKRLDNDVENLSASDSEPDHHNDVGNIKAAKNNLLGKSDSDNKSDKSESDHKSVKDPDNESDKSESDTKKSVIDPDDESNKSEPDNTSKKSVLDPDDESDKSEPDNKSKKSVLDPDDESDKSKPDNKSKKSVLDPDDESDKSDPDNKSVKDPDDKSVKDPDDKSEKSDKVASSENENFVLRYQETPEKELHLNNDDVAKNSLLNDSDEENVALLDQKKATTRQSKKKRIRESVKAKNELLRYSSGSESEDEQLTNVLNDIKKSLLEGMSDDENTLNANNLSEQRKSLQKSSSSVEDIFQKVKKTSTDSDTSFTKKRPSRPKKRLIQSDSEEDKKRSSDGDDDHKSKSSRSKMVRSKAKPGNSSSHSSEAQDPNDKDIDGLANLHTLNKSRRRLSDNTESSSNSTTTRSRMTGKPTGLISEEILKAESSSDAASGDEDEAVEEDLPSVSLAGFNGGLEHLVKEDLLGESDSSMSNKEEAKEDSDEERLKAKRRKANAIASSDSETGTVRAKHEDEDVRLSDFDDSDDSDKQGTKKTKRKKKSSDSDASAGSSDAGKKKRRRIRSVNDSDASGSDSENEGKNKHGRKNIRKVMGKNQLEEATKKAAREEKERVARIAERQKMYNNLQFDESGKPDEVVLDKVVLDFDPETKEPLIAVDRGLVKKLKPHQANGIKFMWDACFESVKRIKKDKGSGCILAHCMGLGKTLQVVALTHTLLAHDSLTKVHRVLVVCPLSTVLNWVNEFKMWLKHAERESDIDVYELSRFKQNGERAFQLSQWFEHGGVCVLGYEMFRNLSADNNKKFKKKMLKSFQEALVDPGPDLVVCDEGHLLKNEKTSLSQSMNKVRTLRRIVLTGTPLQNNLKEYYCMVQFVKPNLLGKYNEYLNRFVNPITNGQYTDSTEHDIKIMKRRSHVLHKMLDGAVQRRDYGVLAPFLPPKHEYVLFITLTEVQTKLYQFYLDNYSRRPLPGKSSGFLFPDFQSLQRIWTHPLVLKYNSERYEIMQQKKRDKEEEDSEGSLVDFIDDDSTPAESSSEDSTDNSSDMSDDSRKKSKKKSSKKSKGKDKDKDKDKESAAGAARRRGTRANPIDLELEDDKDDDVLEVKNENPTEWWIKLVEEDVLEDLRNSHKLVLLFDILRQCETIGDKLLVFSQSLYSLDLIEHFLGKVDEATQEGRIDEKLGNHVGSWSPGVDYFRLDGSTSCENRSIWCKNFNREDNPRARLFLISTRAGGLGINLVAANRVVIFDVSWNPSHDVQSIFRVYRFGQKKPCYVYRFLAMGTMEEKIYERQVTKQAISKRVIDEQQIDRHYAENDLAELYKFEATPPSPRPLPPLPKDRLFAEMLREHEAQIYKYHEHDSLLENKEEETLSEEERKAAWEDFENEKNRPPPAPFPSPWPMNGMMPNLLAQQQQQLAYAALAAMLRKDMPSVNDNQIRDMLPMIYNANPGLMQKMTDIYKYSQQMNMAPGMMGQGGMNSASSGGMAGMGSASGLQYEPPWQRQQQQQQQMRLQQLMAQQQNMGAAAKFYAGGLGSRDPVAMALQQQRAREIMVGGGAGRPRGRPPLQPRGPPAAQADVVNLDSD